MKTVVFVTDLTLWSMGQGNGGPAFTKTIEKYVDEGVETYLISDVKDNSNYIGLDAEHNIIIEESWAKKYIQKRKIGIIFRFIDHILTTKKFERQIENIQKNTKDIILYSYEIYGVKACKNISKKYNIPFVTRFQGTILANYKDNFFYRMARYPHFQALSEKSDLVIMTDDGTQGNRVLQKLGNTSKTLFLQNGLDLIEKKLLYKNITKGEARKQIGLFQGNDEFVFLTVSRLVSWKKVERAINGFSDYLNRGNLGQLIIVGEGDEKKKLEKLCMDLGIAEKVRFTGAIKHEDVYYYMIAADIFMSLYDLSNVGNPLLEAMTLGKCIVTLNVGDTGKIIRNGENGILLEMNELEKLGIILERLYNCPEKREKMALEAKKYACEKFVSWKERMDIEFNVVKNL